VQPQAAERHPRLSLFLKKGSRSRSGWERAQRMRSETPSPICPDLPCDAGEGEPGRRRFGAYGQLVSCNGHVDGFLPPVNLGCLDISEGERVPRSPYMEVG
jgi:hypothetical protein